MEIFQYLDWGIAGILAAIIFIAYRNLVTQQRADRKYIEDRMQGIIEQYHEDSREATESRVENTKVQSELYTWLKARNGHS